MVVDLVWDIISNPINLFLLVVCCVLLYKILQRPRPAQVQVEPEPELPNLKKRDFTLEQLKEYDGRGKDGRVLLSVNGKVFDVTRGKRFYGQGGPYAVFAGRDATRGLATFSLNEDAIKDEFDDISDLNSMQMESVREWEMQMQEKYVYVGRLLKPGEKARDYSDSEDEQSEPTAGTQEDKKDQ